MKSNEFMYWLQGFFELCEDKQLNSEQVTKIKNHLKMVVITDKTSILPFCAWLNGFFEAIETDCLTEIQTNKIKIRLSGIFVHVVEEPRIRQHTGGMNINPAETNILIKC